MTERPLPNHTQENEQMTEPESEISLLFEMDEGTGFVTLTEEGFEPWVTLIQKGNARTVFERLYTNPGTPVDISDIPNSGQVLRYLRNKFGEDPDSTLFESLRIDKQQYAVLNARTLVTPPHEAEATERSQEDFENTLLASFQTILFDPNTSFSAFIEQVGISPKTGEPLKWHEARSEALRIFTRTRFRVRNKKASDVEQDLWSLTKSASGYKRDHEVLQNFVPELLNWFYRQYEKEQQTERPMTTAEEYLEVNHEVDIVIKHQSNNQESTDIAPEITLEKTTQDNKEDSRITIEKRDPQIRQRIREILEDIDSLGIPARVGGTQLGSYYSVLHPGKQEEYKRRGIVKPLTGINDNSHPAYTQDEIAVMRYIFLYGDRGINISSKRLINQLKRVVTEEIDTKTSNENSDR